MEHEKSSFLLKISELDGKISQQTSDINDLKQKLAQTSEELSKKTSELSSSSSKYEEKAKNLNSELSETKKRLSTLISEYYEANIFDKEEISRLNNELLKSIGQVDLQKKEILSLSQTLLISENNLKLRSKCENCKVLQDEIELQKQKISEFECFVHSAEEALGGFFCESLVESIKNLVSAKTQGLRRAPRPPPFVKLRSEPVKQLESNPVDCGPKSALLSEESKKSNSSAISLPEYNDLREELNEEKNESERYLTQIKLLKEDIRELERKLKRNSDLNDKTNGEVLKNTLIQMVRCLPIQSHEVEGMISLLFSIISVPKEEIIKLDPERKLKSSKRFGMF